MKILILCAIALSIIVAVATAALLTLPVWSDDDTD